MRVLQVDSGREWRGGQNQVRLLCRELAREPEIDVRLVTRRGSPLAARVAEAGVAVHEVPWSISLDPRACWRLAHCVAATRPDIVHAHDSHALTVARTALRLIVDPGPRWKRLLWFGPWRFPIVAEAGNYTAPLLTATRRVDFPLGRRSSWRQLDRIIAISEAVKRVLIDNGLPPRGITVVPSGIDPDEVRRAAATPLGIRARLGLPARARLAVNVAALVAHKDQRTLVRAAAAARALLPDLHWLIAGEGELRRALEAEIALQGVGDRVHLLGYVPEADALIGEGDVFVMSSKEEGLGSVILNALALEKPVVATAGGGIPEILPPSALVPVGDHAALGRKVADVLTGPASPVPLPARFTARAMAAGVLAVYRSLA